ncbi:polyprotein [Lates calcarifer birnavirus]|uniref:Structural polyprotein n=1 Tax=Lates calcarifer birnavirus TaxID=2583366 RepID=A0A4P8PKK9_9VIRU|nr:polyprotein [Lates calcarifer birnavirus]QCQ84349.1 polyprotein [Lates calcarifer birnavirus]
MEMTTKSTVVPYLKSLLMPDTGPASIPDDNIERHTIKSEPTTYNLTVGESGSGIIVLYPNSPNSPLGAHYKRDKNNPSKLIFDRAITTSQDLKKAYNFGRLVSRVLSAKSSTLPSGVYSLNGTLSAVTYIGSLSEIGDLDYNKILSTTANHNDKVGNVLAREGVTVLALPTGFDLQFTRMGDDSPSSEGAATVDPSSQPRVYSAQAETSQTITTGTSKNLIAHNLDAITPVTVQTHVSLTTTSPTSVEISLIGLDESKVVTHNAIISGTTGTLTQDVTAIFTQADIKQPIVAMTVKVTAAADITAAQIQTRTTVHGGDAPGVLRPVTIVAYETLAENSILTLAGVSNYELIPNPELSKNIVATYGKLNPQEMLYTKVVLSHRDEIGLKSVWATDQYKDFRAYFAEVADISKPLQIAGAFGWGDVLGFLRRWVFPGINAVLPVAAPLTNFIGEKIQQAYPEAASGHPRAASGRPRAAGTFRPFRPMACDEVDHKFNSPALVLPGDWSFLTPEGTSKEVLPNGTLVVGSTGEEGAIKITDSVTIVSSGAWLRKLLPCLNPTPLASDRPYIPPHMRGRPESPTCTGAPTKFTTHRGALFPTVAFGEGTSVAQTYVALPGDYRHLMAPNLRNEWAPTQDGFKVYGMTHHTIHDNGKPSRKLNIQVATGGNITILPVDKVQWDKEDPGLATVTTSWNGFPAVVGQSGSLALALASNLDYFPQAVFTGCLNNGQVQPVAFGCMKAQAAHALGLKLCGFTTGRDEDIPLYTAEEALQQASTYRAELPYSTRDSLYNGFFYCMAADTSLDEELDEIFKWADENLGSSEEQVDTYASFPKSKDVTTTDATDQALALMEEAAESDPQLAKVLNIMWWVESCGLIDHLYDWTKIDKGGARMFHMIRNAPTPGSKSQRRKYGKEAAGYEDVQEAVLERELQAKLLKAQRLSSAAILNGSPFATPDWIARNDYRGPNQAQNRYFQATGEEPPVKMTEFLQPGTPSPRGAPNIETIASNIYGLPHQAPAPPEFVELVKEVYAENGGRGPNQGQVAKLRMQATLMKGSSPGETSAAPKPKKKLTTPPKPTSARLGRFMNFGGGLI